MRNAIKRLRCRKTNKENIRSYIIKLLKLKYKNNQNKLEK